MVTKISLHTYQRYNIVTMNTLNTQFDEIIITHLNGKSTCDNSWYGHSKNN